ncbi:abc transporter [Diplodia corticola]|uniref:Abc transporter n=1 Tax=Diplodia corticola TaxID=236234 RepID=A0A1J9R995_9PEZI|nr:abc transporter [Diplodia corticola]OJD36754.1 abc transporter [Diplodia corticola]
MISHFDDALPLAHWPACAGACDPGSSALTSPIFDQDRADRYLSAVPAAVAMAVLLLHALLPLLKRRPQWSKRFAAELPSHATRKTWTHWTAILLVLSSVALVLAIAASALPPREPLAALTAIALLIVAIERPKSTPLTLLALLITIFVCQLASLVLTASASNALLGLAISETCISALAVAAIFAMPMRDPNQPTTGISKPFSSPTSELRSPEDNLTLWQFLTVSWMTPLIARGAKRQLNDGDVWFLPYDFQHGRLHTLFRELKGSVVKRLLLANGLDLIITTTLAILESAANLVVPVLLQQLLRAIEHGGSGRKEAVVFATSIFAVRMIAAQSAVVSLWYCRRCYERSRGEMITMIYEKTLTRKSFGASENEKKKQDENEALGVSSESESDQSSTELTKEKGLLARLLSRLRRAQADEKAHKKAAKQPASMGKILNLMRFWEFPDIFTKPLRMIVSVILIWKLLGWPCLFGVTVIILVQLLNAVFVRLLLHWERIRRVATDQRLHATSQFIEAIRHLRWYDWQDQWLGKIMDARQRELNLRVITTMLQMLIGSNNIMAGCLFPVCAFFAYTLLAGRTLSVDVAFPALQLFNMLAVSLRELPGLITTLLNASVAVGRINDFMAEPDKEEEYSELRGTDIAFHDATFAWPGSANTVLDDLNLQFTTGLTVIVGKVGTGKSALLQAVLGELDKRAGDVVVPDEMIGYCAQTPWLQHMSIRENILFSSPLDEARYKQVLEACALTPDMANFKHGDLSDLGENGVGLSGGQRARVALARAIYSPARTLLLDDPLAALDHNTAETIVNRLLRGPLVEGRTILLVTHRVDLVCHLADQIVEIQDNKARLVDAEALTAELHGPDGVQDAAIAPIEDDSPEESGQPDSEPDKFIEEEGRKHGEVVAAVYWEYIKAGKIRWWITLVVIFALFRAVRLFNYWFLKAWGEAYEQVGEQSISFGFSGFFDRLPPPEANVRPWLLWYFLIAMLLTAMYFISDVALLIIVYTAGKRLYREVMWKVSRANFRFYDVTPVGRLMNRVTSDIGTLDGGIGDQLQSVAWYLIGWVAAIVVIASVTPLFLIVSLVLTVWFVYIFMRFLPTSQSLRRLEMVSLSPLMSNFGILLNGLTTIRAFRAQPRFQDRVIAVTDAFQKMDHFYWSLQAWLTYRFDALSAFSTFGLALLALYEDLTPGLTAFMLTSASNFVLFTHSLCKQYGKLQMDFVSVERVVELLHLSEEPAGTHTPPPHWPDAASDIVLSNVTIRYAPHLEPSLSNVTLRIPAGSTCAVVGRTGSGKSTLALALLRTVSPSAEEEDDSVGTITVGGVDLATVDVHAWRQRVTFVAQDPVLFPGTMRDNLDPTHAFPSAQCAAVLDRVLNENNNNNNTPTTTDAKHWTLSSPIAPGGKNLSQGQRQLVGLGRAILRRSPVVVLDEATASIDLETAAAIQALLRAELRESTVVTIAHRVEAVRGADFAVVLERGRVVRAGRVEDGQGIEGDVGGGLGGGGEGSGDVEEEEDGREG